MYFRCYSPVAFGKKTDKDGLYIRKWLPALKDMPSKYIYEPWLAPLSVQRASNCIVGQDYPERIVIHETASKINMQRMKDAYAYSTAQHALGGTPPGEEQEEAVLVVDESGGGGARGAG